MSNFFSLVWVENFKLWRRLSTKIMPLILIGIVIALCALVKTSTAISASYSSGANSKPVPGGWRAELKIENKMYASQIKDAKKSKRMADKNEIGSEKVQIAQNKYYLKHNIRPYNLNKNGTTKKNANNDFWQNVFNFGGWSFAALLAIIACSGLVAGEFTDGTMKTMIPRPFSRTQLLSAKLLAVVGYTAVLVLVCNLCTLGGIALFFGLSGAGRTVLLSLHGGVLPLPGVSAWLLTTLLDFCSTLVYVVVAFFLSAVFRSRALATGLSIFLMFGGSFTALIARNFDWGKFIFFADTSFSNFLQNGPPFYGITLWLALLICALYCIAFLAVSFVTFLKRDIAG